MSEPIKTAPGGSMDVTPVAPNVAPTSNAPFQEKDMPESLKGQSINLEDIESEVPNDAPEGADPLNPEGVVAPKVATKEVAKAPVTPVATMPEKGKLPELPKTAPVTPKPAAPVVTPEKAPKVPAGQRDYSIFTEAELPLVKTLTNNQFAILEGSRRAAVEASQKLTEVSTKLEEREKGGIPSEWYNAPDSYILHPDYQNTHQEFSKANFEAQHYRAQAIAIENNEEWCKIKGYDNRTGQPIYGEMEKPSAEAKVNVQQWMQAAGGIAGQLQGRMQQFQQGFSQHYKALEQKVDSIITDKWPWTKDTKDPRHVMAKQFDDATPKEYHNHPSHKVARLMWTTIFDLAKQLDDAKAQAVVGKTVKQIQEEVEPTVSSVASPSAGGSKRGTGKVTEFSLADDVFKD